MERRTKHPIIITISVCISVLVAVLLVVSLFRDYRQRQEQTAAMESVLAEAAPYEQELEEIQDELEERSAAIAYVSDTARFLVGFELSDVSDVAWVQALAETYSFSPVLVLDCTDELETLETYMDAAAGTDLEIMLFASSFSGEINEDVLAVRAALEERGLEDTGVFVLRTNYASSDNEQLLLDEGFIGYTVYNDTPTAGCTADGAVYFDYSYMVEANDTITSRLSLAYKNKCANLTLFNLGNVWNGTMAESYVNGVLDSIAAYAAYDDACFSTVAEVVEELQSAGAEETQRQQEYDEYAAEQQQRMDELNDIIAGIYAKLSDVF